MIRLERVNSHVEIIVSDTGVGISPEFLPHVFDRFRQAGGSITRSYGGLGLGLAIVRHLVELHGGTVSADSRPGEGATFSVQLPVISVQAVEIARTPEQVHPTAEGDVPWVAPDGDVTRARQNTSGSGRYNQISMTLDGRLVYISDASGTADIWVMDADGKNQRQLTSEASVNVFPAVSPDGRYIAFDSNRGVNPGRFNIWRMDIDGSNPKQLTQGEGEYFPACSPDGKWIVYTPLSSTGRLSLWKIAMDGGDPIQINERISTKKEFRTSGVNPLMAAPQSN